MKTKLGEMTPEAVVQAFKNQNLKVTFKSWGDGITCGCAITAFLKDKGVDYRPMVAKDDTVVKALGRPYSAVQAITAGYDDTQNRYVVGKPGLLWGVRKGSLTHQGIQIRKAVLEAVAAGELEIEYNPD